MDLTHTVCISAGPCSWTCSSSRHAADAASTSASPRSESGVCVTATDRCPPGLSAPAATCALCMLALLDWHTAFSVTATSQERMQVFHSSRQIAPWREDFRFKVAASGSSLAACKYRSGCTCVCEHVTVPCSLHEDYFLKN
jgi:hypothetical protein